MEKIDIANMNGKHLNYSDTKMLSSVWPIN